MEPRLSTFTENGDTFSNYLLIKDVNMNDSGKYVCAPSNAEPASIHVHVVSGKSFINQYMDGMNKRALHLERVVLHSRKISLKN